MTSKYNTILSSLIILLAGETSHNALFAMDTPETIQQLTPQKSKKLNLTTVGDRFSVLEGYYKEDPDNPDPSVFDHLRKWHDQDFTAILSRIKSEENKERLHTYRDAVENAHLDGFLGFHKLAYAYFLYSIVLSNEIDPDSKINGTEINECLHFINTGEGETEELKRLTSLQEIGYKCLPFVNWTGHAGYRTINKAFGLGIPLLGLPLKRSSFDGNLNRLPWDFYGHDVNHAHFELFSGNDLDRIFEQYHHLNNIISEIGDKKAQFLCDYFLYDAGHENYLTTFLTIDEKTEIKDLYSEKDYVSNGMKKLLLTKNTFDDFLERWINQNIVGLYASDLEHFLKTTGLNKNELISDELAHNALEGITDEDYKNQLLGKEYSPNLNQLLLVYNQLVDLKKYLNSQGFNMEIWKGDQIDLTDFTNFHKQVLQAVKENVGPKFLNRS